ncbi:hypothetical protein F8388_002994 [Cannabis sativa]|uniref:Uncharacterized protein n=1 Tax=Cannabis sativa TaxID=3483 RepID=A0A7J6H459_CANSA|nr:hypothetical protein F8388_002994 [Cannabis sativa]
MDLPDCQSNISHILVLTKTDGTLVRYEIYTEHSNLPLSGIQTGAEAVTEDSRETLLSLSRAKISAWNPGSKSLFQNPSRVQIQRPRSSRASRYRLQEKRNVESRLVSVHHSLGLAHHCRSYGDLVRQLRELSSTRTAILKRGFNRLTTDSSPPAKIARVPFLAPRSPPDTGASIAAQPLAAAEEEISDAREGSDVVISTRTPPERGQRGRQRMGQEGQNEHRKDSLRWRIRRRIGRRRLEESGPSEPPYRGAVGPWIEYG